MTESAASVHDSGAAPASRVLGDRELLAVSSREPYTHDFDEADEITVGRPAGGLAAALDPVLQSLGGTWAAWGSGDADREVESAVERINDRFGTDDWPPIRYVTELLPEEGLTALYHNADAALVNSLRDGMNLVAKEYVASQVDDSVLVVRSVFAGAVSMSEAERRRRMARLRRLVNDNPDYRWVQNQFRTLADLDL